MKKTAILLIICMVGSILLPIGAADPPPDQIVTVWGKIYNTINQPIGGLTVTATNLATGNNTTNEDPVTASGGYQIQLGNLPGGWSAGDTIKIESTYEWMNISWWGEETITMDADPPDTIQKELHMEMNDIDNVTIEDVYILLLVMQDDLSSLEDDINTLKQNMTQIQTRLEIIDDTTTALNRRLGYSGTDPENTVYDDLTQILTALIYDMNETGTTWTLDQILENQTTHHEELITLLGNSTQNISVDAIMEKLDILQNTSEDIIQLNQRMFGKINTTITKENTIITKIDNTHTKITDIDNTIANLGDDSDTISTINEQVATQNESLASIQQKIDTVTKNTKDTQGALGTITVALIIIGLIVVGLFGMVIKEYVEEIINERAR